MLQVDLQSKTKAVITGFYLSTFLIIVQKPSQLLWTVYKTQAISGMIFVCNINVFPFYKAA